MNTGHPWKRRIGLPRRVFSQVLLMQLTIAGGVLVLATGLFLRPLGAQLDDQAMRRALAIAETTASPRLAAELLASRPTPGGPVQAEAERIRHATHAEYIVVMDLHGIRWSHTTRSEIGRPVSTSAKAPLSGREVMQIDSGTLGRSARGKVRCATATTGSSARCRSASGTTACALICSRRSRGSSRTPAVRSPPGRWPRI